PRASACRSVTGARMAGSQGPPGIAYCILDNIRHTHPVLPAPAGPAERGRGVRMTPHTPRSHPARPSDALALAAALMAAGTLACASASAHTAPSPTPAPTRVAASSTGAPNGAPNAAGRERPAMLPCPWPQATATSAADTPPPPAAPTAVLDPPRVPIPA